MDIDMGENMQKAAGGKEFHELFMEVFALHKALSNVMDKIHEESGLTSAQRKVIKVASRLETSTVPDVAAQLEVSRQFVQTVCNGLLARGFLEFAENPRHKRSRLVKITESGLKAFALAQSKEEETIRRALPELEFEQVEKARALLEEIRKAVEFIV